MIAFGLPTALHHGLLLCCRHFDASAPAASDEPEESKAVQPKLQPIPNSLSALLSQLLAVVANFAADSDAVKQALALPLSLSLSQSVVSVAQSSKALVMTAAPAASASVSASSKQKPSNKGRKQATPLPRVASLKKSSSTKGGNNASSSSATAAAATAASAPAAATSSRSVTCVAHCLVDLSRRARLPLPLLQQVFACLQSLVLQPRAASVVLKVSRQGLLLVWTKPSFACYRSVLCRSACGEYKRCSS